MEVSYNICLCRDSNARHLTRIQYNTSYCAIHYPNKRNDDWEFHGAFHPLFKSFTSEFETHQDKAELILSLGGTPKQAVHKQLITSIQASTIPTIESQKTIGLVQLPGMMSGQIMAGADPVQAVQFQLLVLFLLLTAAVVTSAMLGFLSYPSLFNERMQLIKLREE